MTFGFLELQLGNMQDFQQWFTRKFLEWQLDRVQSISLTDFAEHLGISHQVASLYKNGKGVPSGDNLYRISKHYPEVYEVLGVEPEARDFRIVDLADMWDGLAKEIRDALYDMAHKGRALNALREKKPDGSKTKKTR